MGYSLQAIVAKSDVLRVDGLQVIQLPQSFALCSLNSSYREIHSIPFLAITDEGLEIVPGPISSVCQAVSERGVVAYLEAEISGGEGIQASVVWSGGKIVQPLLVDERAINVALKLLGVERGDSIDEFDAIHLGRHRNIDDWCKDD